MEGGPIPVSVIRSYARDELEMDEDLVFFFTTILREMDTIYLKLCAEQREKMSKNKKPTKKPSTSTPAPSTKMEAKRIR